MRAVHFEPYGLIDDNATVPPGTLGTVSSVDETGVVHVHWDNGARLGVGPGGRFDWLEDERLTEDAFLMALIRARTEIAKATIESRLTRLSAQARGAGLAEVSEDIDALHHAGYRHQVARLRKIAATLTRRLDR